jgi:hypothetical protein
MNRALLVGMTAMGLVVAGETFAEAVKLAPEQRSKIQEYVLKTKDPVTIADRAVVGNKLPTTVPLAPVPTSWGSSVAKYGYFLTPVPTVSPSGTTYDVTTNNNQVVLVEPSTREIVAIVTHEQTTGTAR